MLNITPLFPLYVFNACHLSKIYLQSEIKHDLTWHKTFRFSVSKTFEFLFRKNELFLESIFCINIGRNNFQFCEMFENETWTWIFSQVFFCIFLLFRNAYLKEHLWVAVSIYFTRESSQKCERSNYFLEGVLI